MRKTYRVASALIALAATTAPTIPFAASPTAAAAASCCTPNGTDWPHVNGSLGAQAYSSLTQINKGNIKNLGPAWVVHTNVEPVTSPVPGPGSASVGQQTTPVVVDGVMYLDTPGGGVIALDAASGAVKWKWQPSVAANGFGGNNQHRGVSVGDGKVFTTAAGSRVVALDKNTGQMVWAVQPTDAQGNTVAGLAKVATVYHDGIVYLGTNDNARGAAIALRAADGATAWVFYSAYPAGTSFTDVNGTTFDAGATWTTKNTPNDTPNDCYLTGGGAPWMHPSIDPELGMVYYTFGNPRSCTGAQWGSGRPGDNLFTNSLVAIDLKTGAYKWHFQSVRHDIWDMDNVHTPTMADVQIKGQTRKVIYYGSKSSHQFVIDRTTGKPALPIVQRQVPIDQRQLAVPTQPFPAEGGFMDQCLVYQNLGSEVPGAPNRAVPNWNGYQAQPDPANPGQMRLVYNPQNYLAADTPYLGGPERQGCMYDPHWEDSSLFLSMTSQNGGNDFSNVSISPKLNLRYIGYAYNPVAHGVFQGGNGLRQIGGYQSGGLVAVDASTNLPVWRKEFGPGGDMGHGNHPLVTASDLLFVNRFDGWLLAMDAATGEELWRFQTGAPSASGVVTYTVNGEQYIAMPAMAGTQPYAQGGQGAAVWAFKLGGKAVYTTGPRSNPVVVSGSSEAPAPLPIANLRRPVGNATSVVGVPPDTVYIARSNGTANADKDSVATTAMLPSQLRVTAGTTVTFTNPGDATFGVAGSGNLKEHCATQFFEGLFNFRLKPGESAQFKFDREGEYFYNDCADPRPVGKIVVTLEPQVQAGALKFVPEVLNLRAANGQFTSVQGLVTATFQVPAGYVLDGRESVQLKTPLTEQRFTAQTAQQTGNGRTLVVTFDKALVDNNIPAGDAVPLTVTANFMHDGVQKKLSSTATVRVMK